MLRKRTQAQSSIDELLRTVCTIDGAKPVSLDMLPAATQSGMLTCATIDQMAHVNEAEGRDSYWVELRGDVLTFRASQTNRRKVRGLAGPKQVAFCATVQPPPASACASPELRAIADKLLANNYMVIYTTDGHGYWLGCGDTVEDFTRWQKVSPNVESNRAVNTAS